MERTIVVSLLFIISSMKHVFKMIFRWEIRIKIEIKINKKILLEIKKM